VVASNAPVFAEVIKRAGRRLGTALAKAVAILDPELVLLGGETLQLLGDRFVETIILEIGKSAMPSKPLPPVRRSSLGASAGAIGAATLVLHDAYAPRLQLLNLIAPALTSEKPQPAGTASVLQTTQWNECAQSLFAQVKSAPH
jgi:ROK family